MPDGGIPLGCQVCKYAIVNGDDTQIVNNHCQLHDIPITMDNVCWKFEVYGRFQFYFTLLKLFWRLRKNILYLYTSVPDENYPPPEETVPFGNISEIQTWEDEDRKLAFENARLKAKEMYENRQARPNFF